MTVSLWSGMSLPVGLARFANTSKKIEQFVGGPLWRLDGGRYPNLRLKSRNLLLVGTSLSKEKLCVKLEEAVEKAVG